MNTIPKMRTVPEFTDPVFAGFYMTENERFGLVFAKTGSINSGTSLLMAPAKSLQSYGQASDTVKVTSSEITGGEKGLRRQKTKYIGPYG